jgi:hypothetical protein
MSERTMTTMAEDQDQSKQTGLPEGYHTFLAFHFGVKCLHCNAVQMDPDKKRNQTHLKGKCFVCGKDSKDYKNPNRKPKKISKKEKKRRLREQDAAARGKY